MDYTPKPAQAPAPAPATYELKKDVTGQPPEKRGVQIVKDKNGTEVRLPYPPKKDCKKCFGRGYVGMNAKTGRLIVCGKCYRIA